MQNAAIDKTAFSMYSFIAVHMIGIDVDVHIFHVEYIFLFRGIYNMNQFTRVFDRFRWVSISCTNTLRPIKLASIPGMVERGTPQHGSVAPGCCGSRRQAWSNRWFEEYSTRLVGILFTRSKLT